MRLLVLLCITCAMVYGQQASAKVDAQAQPLPSPPTNQPTKEKQSSAQLSGSGKIGTKGDITGNFPGLTIAKGGGKTAQNAKVNHDGAGTAGATAGNGASFVAKQNAKVAGKANSVTYGADKLPSGAPAFGSADLDKNTGLGHGSFNGGKGERQSAINSTKSAKGEKNVILNGGKQTGVAKGVGADGKDKFTFDAGANSYNVDPNAQAKTGGDGTIASKSAKGKGDGNYKYTIKNGGTATKGADVASTAQLADAAPSAGRSAFDWTCTGSNNGASVCKNAKGEEVGKALKDDQGNVVIYDKKGTIVGRSDVEKGKGPKEYNVNIGQKAVAKTAKASDSSLYLAGVDNWQRSDCYKDVAKKANPYPDAIKLKSPYKFIYNQASPGKYNYPDCFKIVGQVYIAKGIDVKTLAVEFQARINPVGDLKCADPGACGRECYYCDICKGDSIRWKLANSNTDAKDTCARTGGGDWYEIGATVCPPPDSAVPVCSSFERSYSSDYWTSQKQDTLQVTLLFWKRPAGQSDIENNFFYRLKNEGDSFRKSVQLQAQLSGALKGKGASASLSDFELKEAYVRGQLLAVNASFKEELVYCDKSTTDYNMAGSKVGGKYLVGAADALQKNGTVASNVYSKPVCKDVAQLQKDEIDALQKKWVAAGSPKGSNGGLLSGVNLAGLTGAKSGTPVFGGL